VSALEGAFGRLGVLDAARIVVYAGTESVQSATRVWFTLDYLGLGDRAALLDGGLALWKAEGRPLGTQPASVQPRKFTAHVAPQLVVSAEWIREHHDDPNVQLLDARLPEFYTGANAGGMPRAGHTWPVDARLALKVKISGARLSGQTKRSPSTSWTSEVHGLRR
jgi:thiosulfate/3-mercaptopyruvate sulfurtransferase